MKDEDLDHTPWVKGKYKGRTADEVAQIDPSYLVWAYEAWSPKPCSAILYKDCKADVARDRQSYRVAKDQDLD